jgi:hypothetical protein
MDTDTTPVETKGISRRAVIVGGATGAAAFWSVPIIDSVISRAAAGSTCPPPAALAISGAAVVYTVGTSSTVYWAAFASNGTTCLATPSVPQDDDFGPIAACGAFVQVNNGNVLYGATALTVAIPAVNSTCYFTATNNGVSVTPAGVTAGVKILIFLAHNGTIPSNCTQVSSKHHWALVCGSTNPQCPGLGNCF